MLQPGRPVQLRAGRHPPVLDGAVKRRALGAAARLLLEKRVEVGEARPRDGLLQLGRGEASNAKENRNHFPAAPIQIRDSGGVINGTNEREIDGGHQRSATEGGEEISSSALILT